MPGKNQRHDEITAELRHRVKSRESMILPTSPKSSTAVYGRDHRDGEPRRTLAEGLARLLAVTVTESAPWTLNGARWDGDPACGDLRRCSWMSAVARNGCSEDRHRRRLDPCGGRSLRATCSPTSPFPFGRLMPGSRPIRDPASEVSASPAFRSITFRALGRSRTLGERTCRFDQGAGRGRREARRHERDAVV